MRRSVAELMRHVLDASALLALLLDEPGAAKVTDIFDMACIGNVSLAEVASMLVRKGGSAAEIKTVMATLGLPVLVSETALAMDAGLLWSTTRSAGSSLGDRFCLALARRLGAVLMTTDTRLADIAPAADVRAIMIR